nr:hypothetical protein [Tanacetum cinerariifolium]
MSLFHQRECRGCGQPCDGYYCNSCTYTQCGMTLFNEICDNCIYGNGKPIICTACGSMVKEEDSITYNLVKQFLYNNFLDEDGEDFVLHYLPNLGEITYSLENLIMTEIFEKAFDKSFPCYDNREESHENFQCQPITFQIDFSGSDQIQTPQYPDIHFFSQETSDEVFQANHSIQNEESFENPSNEIVVSNPNEEKEIRPQDSDFHQLIEECSTEICEEQKQSMEDTMLELVKICQEKEFLCIHDDVDDLIESALKSKLLLINSNSQRLDKKEQEVKNVVEQPVERRNRNIQSLQNFRVVHKSSISLNTSQISSIHTIAPILSTKEHEHLLSMRYKHLSITPEMESNNVTESNAENLLPIPSKCEVTLEDKIECDMPIQDQSFTAFTTFSNPLFNNNDDLDSSDDESLPDEDVPLEDFKVYSNPLFDEDEIDSDKLDPHYFNVESDFVESLLNRNTFIDFSSKFDFSGILAHVNPEISKSDFDFEEEIRLIESVLYDNSSPRPPEELNAEIADAIVESIPLLPIPVHDGDFQREEIDVVTETDDVLPLSVENDDDSSDDPLLEEADLFLSDNSIPSGIENDNPSIPRSPSKPPDAETDTGEEIPVVINNKDKFDEDYLYFMFLKKFPNIPKRLEDDYHFIKDDVPLIRETNAFKEYEMMFTKVAVPMNQPQPVVSTQRMHRVHLAPIVKKDDDESKDMIDPESHKDNPEFVDDDDDKEREKPDNKMGSLEELTNTASNPTISTSKHSTVKKRISIKYSHLLGALRMMCMRQGYMIQDMERKYVTTVKFWETPHTIDDILHEVVPQITENVTNDLIETNLKACIVNTIIEDRDAFYLEVPAFVCQEFKAHAPAIIEELFKNHEALRRKFEKSSSNTFCREDDFHSHHDKHQDDDAPPEGEKRVKRKENVIDEDEVIPEDVKLMEESQNVEKRVPTIFDHAIIEATMRDSLSNLCSNAEEYAYHLEQLTSFMENQIVWESRQQDISHTIPKTLIFYGPQKNPNEPPRPLYNKDLFFLKYGNTKEKKYILSLYKIHAEEFP